MRLTALTICLLLLSTAVPADGPGAYRPRERAAAPTSETTAIEAYNAGYALIQRADHADNLAAASTKDSERKAAQRKARDAYEESLKRFAAAVRSDASMHEAYTYMGYANRKLGRHADALTAYEQALRINPDYPHAIEYQGQAFLALNRIDEARFNYLRLYALNPKQAAKLIRGMQDWLDANKDNPPAGIDIEAFSAWVAERSALVKPETAGASSW